MPNRLVTATSPYLLQHAENPVDWFPWGDEAFELARKLDRPVFLSVGYSSCHWCHVMAHESFEDEEVGKLLNDHFVCIKVDREERPDVDEAYMTAVQLMSGRGGWPMSVFMTPDRRPFVAGTYWPKDSFNKICSQVSAAWKTRRQEVEESATQIAEAIKEALNGKPPEPTAKLDAPLLDRAVEGLLSDFDHANGGFGTAPKFPPHTGIEFLLRYALTQQGNEELQQAALSASMITLQHMVMGGIHDHIGGGFHRYSTDETWLLPHFEKMLYDNALMLGNLATAVEIAAQIEPKLAELLVRAAHGIIDWLMRGMTGEEGFFFSALDADSEGEEGKFYVWSVQEVTDLLQHHAPVFLQSYGFEVEGNFADESTGRKTGANIPHLVENLSGQFDQELAMLRQTRDERVRPGLDDKGLIGWNGLAIGALAEAGIWPLAQNAVVAILAAEKKHGKLPHQIAKGTPSGEAFLEDYAYFIEGLFKLAVFLGEAEETGQRPEQSISPDALIQVAERLANEMVAKFYDEAGGAFFSTSVGHEELFGRTKPVFDQPLPSANSVAIRCLLHLGDMKRARQSIEALLGWMQRAPQATESLYTTAMLFMATSALMPPEPVLEVPVAVPVAPAARTVQVLVTLSAKEIKADSSGIAAGSVKIVIPEGSHINSPTPPARWLIPTKLSFNGIEGKVSYPEATNDQYTGAVEIPFTVQIPGRESGAEFEIKVTYQACTETECQAPQEKVFGVVAYK